MTGAVLVHRYTQDPRVFSLPSLTWRESSNKMTVYGKSAAREVLRCIVTPLCVHCSHKNSFSARKQAFLPSSVLSVFY